MQINLILPSFQILNIHTQSYNITLSKEHAQGPYTHLSSTGVNPGVEGVTIQSFGWGVVRGHGVSGVSIKYYYILLCKGV